MCLLDAVGHVRSQKNEAKLPKAKGCRSQNITKTVWQHSDSDQLDRSCAAQEVPRVSSRSFASVDVECVEVGHVQLSQSVLEYKTQQTLATDRGNLYPPLYEILGFAYIQAK